MSDRRRIRSFYWTENRVRYTRPVMRFLLIVLFAAASLFAQQPAAPAASDLMRHARAEMDFLASDEMQGRKSFGPFEAVAGAYLASQFESMGLAPGGDTISGVKTYFQNVPFKDELISDGALKAADKTLKLGDDIRIARLSDATFNGKLFFWKEGASIPQDAVVYFSAADSNRTRMRDVMREGAAAILTGYGPDTKEFWEALGTDEPTLSEGRHSNVLFLSEAATAAVSKLNANTPLAFTAQAKSIERRTRNIIAILPGKTKEVVMISAHYDHIGTKPGQPDPIYNGADDDASGTIAVLELARFLAAGPQPRRTVYFVLFGAEEPGSIGGGYFEQHPVMPLDTIAAQIEFEMIGRPDPKVAPGTLWMAGYDRSNLGPELAKHGAALVADPHPEQHFFERSDNYPLAKRGVVAHSISSFGLHKQYHQPDDDIAHIDFAHLTHAIQSMMAPVRWLVDSDFKPQWEPGKQPTP